VITMLVVVTVGGLVLLLVLAVTVGYIEGRAQRDAWSRVAAERRELWAWEQELIEAAEARGCAGCRIWRRRAEGLPEVADPPTR